MKVFLTGATGFIGSAVLARLVERGHRVTAVVRRESSLSDVAGARSVGVVGDLFDLDWVAAQLRDHDGAIHTAAAGDDRDPDLNEAVIQAVLSAFGATAKPFVHTGGIWVYGDNDDISETDELSPPALVAWRVASEARLLRADVRASIIQPAVVHGHGQGMVNLLAPRDGEVRLIGSGEQHWGTVHVDDLADLYVRALETAPGGKAYVGASGHNPTVRELGEAMGDRVIGESDDATRARFGAFGAAMLTDQQASGNRAREELGWMPTRRHLVDDLEAGYFDS